jgi:hypothetical protein
MSSLELADVLDSKEADYWQSHNAIIQVRISARAAIGYGVARPPVTA